jgi:hypothetical protein
MSGPVESKGSRQYRSIVIPYRPSLWVVVALSVVLVSSGLLVAGVKFGGDLIHADYSETVAERDHLVQLLSEREVALTATKQQLANMSVGSEVDRQAMGRIRLMIAEQQQIIAELEEENTFYKGLMAPSEQEQGLSIRGWELVAANDDRHFYFKLVVQQVVLKHALLKGELSVMVQGSQNGEGLSLSLAQLSDQIVDEQIRLRFKYFQSIEGELNLPDGFVPQRVIVVASAVAPKAARVEKQFNWPVSQ